ncbi:hypothetical protein Ahy_B03g062518 [Arachis hypogaea]|uniref:Aminotransferase-like plant mobile domain-containing protein n=1 Tax=Arachis hypogaea TaxID=3818 RepID=A0A444ZUG0_ARAHY|nr:hypothetical protein Ahy_B03g062518 [Arachis hypogaea]
MEDERRLYWLDGVAHVAETIDAEPTRCVYSVRRQQNIPLHDRITPYLERAVLYHLARLNAHWFWLDEPLDVAYQLGLPVDGQVVFGCMTDFHMHIEGARPVWEWFEKLFGELPPPDKRKLYTVHFTWFHERFRVLPADASEETVRIYARAYITMLLSTQLFMDKSANRVHIRWLPFVARLYDMGSYSWGAAALAWLYRCMCRVANRNVTNLAGPLQLLQSWIFWPFSTLRPPGFDAFSFPLASKGSSQAPTRVPASDMPDNKCLERRLRIGTRATDRDWRWLDDMMQEEQVGGDDGGHVDHRLRRSSARRRAARGGRAPPVHHNDEAGSSRQHPTDTHAGGTAEASMGCTPFTHVSSSQVLDGCSTQQLADLATTSFTMDLDDQLGGPQFYADFDEFIRDDDVH